MMMRKRALTLLSVLGFLWLTLLLSACGIGTADPAATPTVTPAATAATAPTATAQPEATATPGEDSGGLSVPDVGQVSTAVADRTPVPTPTPGAVEEGINELVQAAGLAGKSFLGLTVEDWINLVFSALIAVLGYLVGDKLLFGLLKRIARRTSTKFDDAFLDTIGGELKELVMILVTRFALLRLDFWGDGLRTFIDDVSFALVIVVVVAISLRLIRFAGEWYQKNLGPDKDKKRLDPIIAVVERMGYVLVMIIGVSMLLSQLGINISALSAALIFSTVILYLGAKDNIADAISGFIILIDQPFRVGDTIEIEKLNRRGTVVEVGTRTTQIRTGDNRLVIVPNSTIGASQVINYSYPDPKYQVHIEIGVAYGSDFDQVRSVIKDAVSGVDGVLPDEPVDALFYEFGDSSRTMHVRWWIDNVKHEKPIIDQVCEALENALGKAGIDLPFNTASLIVQVDPETIKQLSPSLQKPEPDDQASAGSSPNDSETE